jgi:hypothetical protein
MKHVRLFLNSAILALALLAMAGLAATARSAPYAPAAGEAPDCVPSTTRHIYATARPTLRGVTYGVQVAEGTRVEMYGVAEVRTRPADCSTLNVEYLPYTWSLTFTPAGGGPPEDRTSSLHDTATLYPWFMAEGLGTYHVLLLADGHPWPVPVQVIASDVAWSPIGPDGTRDAASTGEPADTATGRVNAIAFDPSQPGVLYAGSAWGGVFKTWNGGAWWVPVTDQKGLPALGISALAVDGAGTIYAGLGDLRGEAPAHGIWKSADGGRNWAPAGATLDPACPAGSVAFTGLVYRMVISPANASVIHVAAREGLFRSLNGGKCWQRIPAVPGPVRGLAMKPDDPKVVYAATPTGGGIMKTTDAEAATPVYSALPLPSGLSYSDYTVIHLAVSAADPGVLYAALAVGHNGVERKGFDILRYTLAGGSVEARTWVGEATYSNIVGGLTVSPLDANRVFAGEVWPWQSVNGGGSWARFGGYFHADIEDLAWAPDDPDLLYIATDGGVYRMRLQAPGVPAGNWEVRNFQLNVAQAGSLGLSPVSGDTSAAGMWDIGTKYRLYGSTWQSIADNDGYLATFDAASARWEPVLYDSFQAADNGSFQRGQVETFFVYGPAYIATVRLQRGSAILGASSPNEATIGDPMHPGRLFGVSVSGVPFGTNARNDHKLYVAEGANTATGALTWVCVHPNTTAAGVYSLEFGLDGSYYVSLDDGSVYRFTLPEHVSGAAFCSSGSTAAQGVELIYQTGHPVRITGDPFDSHALYAFVKDASGPWRVLHLTQATPTWTATPLAGWPPDVGSLPNGLDFGAGRRNQVAFAADPVKRGQLWLGTRHGLWRGDPVGSNEVAWANDPVPETDVREIAARRLTDGRYSGELQMGTYGRGVWERLLVHTPPAANWLDPYDPACTSCQPLPNAVIPIHNPQLPETERPSADVALLAVDYNYDGSHGGASIVARAMREGKTIDNGFQSEIVQFKATPATGTAFLRLFYDDDAPDLSQPTDAVRFDLIAEDKTVLASQDAHLDRLWMRPDGRSVTVEAILRALSRIPAGAKVEVDLGDGNVLTSEDRLRVAVATGSKVGLAAPAEIETPYGKAVLVAWAVNGVDAGDQPTYGLTVDSDVNITAEYELPEGLEEYPPPETTFLPLLVTDQK